ncbi:MAG: hypothetical protein ABW204_02260, partial [Microbacteriaceae bacterium]
TDRMSGDGQQHERAQRTIDGRAAVAALLGVLAPVLAFLGAPVLGVPAALGAVVAALLARQALKDGDDSRSLTLSLVGFVGGAVVLLLVALRQLVPFVLSPMLMAPIPF